MRRSLEGAGVVEASFDFLRRFWLSFRIFLCGSQGLSTLCVQFDQAFFIADAGNIAAMSGRKLSQSLRRANGSNRPIAARRERKQTTRCPSRKSNSHHPRTSYTESVLHGAEMSSISDLSEYQAINAFDAYQVSLQWTSKQGKILDCVCFCIFFPLRMIAPQ